MVINKDKNSCQGIVVEAMPGGVFKVDIGNNNIIKAYLSGKIRKFNIRIMIGDEVTVEFGEHDQSNGRIVFRKIKSSNV